MFKMRERMKGKGEKSLGKEKKRGGKFWEQTVVLNAQITWKGQR